MTLPGSGSLYCSSDGVRGRGAAMTNLSHDASFQTCGRIAPANRGIKRLDPKVTEQKDWTMDATLEAHAYLGEVLPTGTVYQSQG